MRYIVFLKLFLDSFLDLRCMILARRAKTLLIAASTTGG